MFFIQQKERETFSDHTVQKNFLVVLNLIKQKLYCSCVLSSIFSLVRIIHVHKGVPLTSTEEVDSFCSPKATRAICHCIQQVVIIIGQHKWLMFWPAYRPSSEPRSSCRLQVLFIHDLHVRDSTLICRSYHSFATSTYMLSHCSLRLVHSLPGSL